MCGTLRRLSGVSSPQERGLNSAPGRKRQANKMSTDGPKQEARHAVLQAAYLRAEAARPRDKAPTAGQIRSLGLLGKEEETKAILDSQ